MKIKSINQVHTNFQNNTSSTKEKTCCFLPQNSLDKWISLEIDFKKPLILLPYHKRDWSYFRLCF